jgi:hypothetical protein
LKAMMEMKATSHVRIDFDHLDIKSPSTTSPTHQRFAGMKLAHRTRGTFSY